MTTGVYLQEFDRRQLRSRRKDDIWPEAGAVVIVIGVAAFCGFGVGFLIGWMVG
jgi:hypothetical protein